MFLRAGDRAPDATAIATAKGTRRLFDLTRGTHFTLLSFSSQEILFQYPSVTVFRVAPHLGRENDISDTNGELGQAYGAGDKTLVLIRPDGYIALISDAGELDCIKSYLAQLDHVMPPSPAEHEELARLG